MLQAALTPVIALIALYIARQQWKTAHNRFRLDYFDRRFGVYEAAMTLTMTISSRGSITHDELLQFAKDTKGVEFFFDEEIKQYCNKLYSEALCIEAGKMKIDSCPSGEQERSVELLQSRMQWFVKQESEIYRLFKPYLRIKG